MIKLPEREDVIFSLKSFIGAMLALYLAFRLGLPRPFWAPLTAYVVSQPIAGAVRSKALYRVMGTIIGALATVILIPLFINYSVVLCLVLGLWFGLCLFISLQDRTPRAYAFMLAGYSVGLITMPSLIDVSGFSISSIYDVALARVEEITLGILCSALVHSLILPKGVGNIVLNRLDQALRDARQWVGNVLTETRTGSDNSVNLNKLAQTITELRMMSTHLPYDTSNLRWTANIVRALQDRTGTGSVSDRRQAERLAQQQYRQTVGRMAKTAGGYRRLDRTGHSERSGQRHPSEKTDRQCHPGHRSRIALGRHASRQSGKRTLPSRRCLRRLFRSSTPDQYRTERRNAAD